MKQASPQTRSRAPLVGASVVRTKPYLCLMVGSCLVMPAVAWAQEDIPPLNDMMAIAANRAPKLAIAAAIGFAIGAFCSPMARPFRAWLFGPVLKLLLILGGIALTLFALFSPTPLADELANAEAVGLLLLSLFFALGLGRKPELSPDRARPTSFGSAKWATYDYLSREGLLDGTGFLLGDFTEGRRRADLRYSGARHLLTVAPTRSGKGVSSIIPNLLLHDGSALVIDPKGENALITAARRGTGDAGRGITGMKQSVFLLDPWDIAASKLDMNPSRFNPLDWIRDDPDAVENAFLLADALVIKEGGGESAFWDEEAKALLTGIILYVATAPEEAEHRTLGRVRDILTMGDDDLKEVLDQMFQHPTPVVSSTAARTVSKDAKLRSSVMASAQAHTHFLDSPRIRESLSATDFKFEDIKTKPQTIYLILPADRLVTFNRLLRLLIQQAITVNARNIGERPKRPILFMLDEMPTLGRLPSIEQAYGLMAGFGMQLWGIVQDLSQLASIYGEHGWQTFISNCGVIQYMGSRDKMTADYFSSLCGVTTIEVRNVSTAIGRAISWATGSSSSSGPGGHSSGSSSTTTESNSWTRTHGVNEAQRQLAYPDELMVLKGDQQLVFVENLDPIPARKVVWFEDAGLKTLGANLNLPPALKAHSLNFQ